MMAARLIIVFMLASIAGSASAAKAYDQLADRLRDIYALQSVQGLLGWDGDILLPAAATDARATQSAALAAAVQLQRQDPALGALLRSVKATELPKLGPFERANVRLADKWYTQVTKLTPAFVRRESEVFSQVYEGYSKAQKKNSFSAWVPTLKAAFDITKERAKLVAPAQKPFEYIITSYCDLSNARVAQVFADLKKDLVPLVRRLRANGTAPATAWLNNLKLDPAKLSALSNEIIRDVGLNPNALRVDKSNFSTSAYTLTRTDTRVTLADDTNDLQESLTGLMFTLGGTLSIQGQPKSQDFLPVSSDFSLSQSLMTYQLYERRLTLSRPFAAYLLPKLRKTFPAEFPANITADVLYGALAAVENPSMIRRDADELTYPLHIIIRYEIEAAVFNGSLAVADIPKAWNAKMKAYLGVVPKNDNEGALQDIQWANGLIGGFGGYSIAAMAAVQVYDAAVRKNPGLEAEIAKGNLIPLKTWMASNIWNKGSLYPSVDALLKATTGKPLDPAIYVKFLTDKFTKLYKL